MSTYTDDMVRAKMLAAALPSDVDSVVRSIIDAGGAADYIAVKGWWPVKITGGGHTLTIWVAPDYAALGSSYRISRTTPFGAQSVADTWNAILPSYKLLKEIQNASNPKIPFIDIKGAPWHFDVSQIATPAASDAANSGALSALASRGIAPGSALTIGYKKAIVVAPNLDGSKVAIAGGMWPDGSIVQPYATPHPSSYSDYSHGIVLILRKAQLDGHDVDLRMDVFGSTDPSIYGLVSDMGRFDPVYPNAGPSSRAKFGASGGGGGGGGGGGSASPKPSPTPPAPPAPPTSSGTSIASVLIGIGVAAAIGGGVLYSLFRWIP